MRNNSVKRVLTVDKNYNQQMLEKQGIQYIDSNLRNFENISPIETAEFYENLGDWQDVLPKTDYAYSALSIYYKKKINGIYPVVPNMSRPLLWNYVFQKIEVIDNDINTKKENYFLKSYQSLENTEEWSLKTSSSMWRIPSSFYWQWRFYSGTLFLFLFFLILYFVLRSPLSRIL